MSTTTTDSALAAVDVARTRVQHQRRWRSRQWLGLVLVLPSLGFVGLFFLLPLMMTFWMSLHDWPLLGMHHFIGLGNYREMLHDSGFWHAMVFTLEYTVIVTVLLFGAAFPMALYVERPRRGVGLLRTAYFMPAVVGLASGSLLWVWLVNDDSGLVTAAAERLGLTDQPLSILSHFWWAFLCIVLMVVWKMAGFTMMLLLPGLQAIPGELHEAARIDGATGVQRFYRITLPLMRRTLAMTLILSVTGSILAFDQFYIISTGGPENRTITAVYWIVNTSFVSFRMGYGAALSIVLMLILLAINLVQMYVLRTREDA
jgi:multiple sugar transport system permease protein